MWRAVATAAGILSFVLALRAAGAAPPADYAAVALNVMPPGQNGELRFDRHTNDQVRLYDCLTPLFDRVTARDLRRCFKPAALGLAGERPARVERPRRGILIERDRWGVPHVSGTTAEDVAFGAGWATAEDRSLLLELMRGPARAAALDVPGLDAFSLVTSGRTLVPSPQAEARLAAQIALVRKLPLGPHFLRVVDAYAAGINAFNRARGVGSAPFTRNDVAAVGALLAARFGASGGAEVENAMFLDALAERLGEEPARRVFDDLRRADDPEAPVSVPGRFPHALPPASAPGGVVIDDGSFEPVRLGGARPLARPRAASNALLVGRSRSATGHPLFVAGPQIGYSFPGFFMEIDLQGGGFAARGALLPGLPLVLVGRGPDFAWTATSALTDVQDVFVETLCGGDTRYVFRGECREMTIFDAGVLRAPGRPDERLLLRETVHGPVQGYATVGGRRVAISLQRSTRGRELLSALPLFALDTGAVRSAREFVRVAARIEAAFDLLYADDREIAFVSAGRLPVRAPGTDPALPVDGRGAYEWRGFLPAAAHPQAIDPADGVLVNWNNKPAARFGASDDNWSWGPVHRSELLERALPRGKLTLERAVAAVNRAATQDLRAVVVMPVVAAVLATGPAPSPRAQRLIEIVQAWARRGGSRLDRDGDGLIDDPGAAILDAAWPRIADAVLEPVLGPLVDRLAALEPRDDAPDPQGSAYQRGWYGYVEKDLRALLGRPVAGPFRTRFCGGGVLAACRASLWAALDAAGAELAAEQGPDPAAWRADATRERISFSPGLLRDTMRWANRPTFQQVVSFSGHRPR